MSQALFNARRGVAQVSTLVKQGKYMAAVQNTHVALKTLVNTSLMRAEQEELKRLVTDACDYIANNSEIRKIFPLAIEFAEGKEQELLSTLTELAEILESEAHKDIHKLAEQIAQKKQTALDEGQMFLDSGEHAEAKRAFAEITAEFHDDADLAANVGERFLQGGLYEEASHYLGASADLNPNSAHVFNRLGIALRKMKRFDISEKNFLRAIEIEKNDPNLYFNLGRLYLDMKKWPESVAIAEMALSLDANFTEARQLANYANKQITENK